MQGDVREQGLIVESLMKQYCTEESYLHVCILASLVICGCHIAVVGMSCLYSALFLNS